MWFHVFSFLVGKEIKFIRMEITRIEGLLIPYEVQKELICNLSLRDLYALCLTSKTLRGFFLNALEKRRTIVPQLEKFVSDVSGLRDILSRTDAVIAGELARRYFLGEGSNTFDIVIPNPCVDDYDSHACWYEYLKSEGYRREPDMFWQSGRVVSASPLVTGEFLLTQGTVD